MKARRQQAILDLVAAERLGSQQEIRARLEVLGYPATQSTISRDVEELGLARIHDAQGTRYVAPAEVPGGSAAGPASAPLANGHRKLLRNLLQEYAVSFSSSVNLLVITTPPGAANILAEAIDRTGLPDIAGTVAGDNTILVVSREGATGRKVERVLQRIMEGRS
jgi:transcriptional regulator of arginine metabolism